MEDSNRLTMPVLFLAATEREEEREPPPCIAIKMAEELLHRNLVLRVESAVSQELDGAERAVRSPGGAREINGHPVTFSSLVKNK